MRINTIDTLELIAVIIVAVLAGYIAVYAQGCHTPIVETVAPDVGDPGDCALACGRLIELGCDGAEGSPGKDGEWGTEDDASCIEVCRIVVESGIGMNQECVSKIEGCSDLDNCLD